MSPKELDPNAEDIWQDLRDHTPTINHPDLGLQSVFDGC
jgi:hypothetical protein